jgi:hypothetical protein
MGISVESLGAIHEMQGEYAAALEKYEEAKKIFQRMYPDGLPMIEQDIARVRGKMGG